MIAAPIPSFAAGLTARFFRPGEWLLARFSDLDRTRWPLLWVIGLFAVQAIPATLIRASNLEEGRVVAMARGALEDGHWITPYLYGERFAERPVLLSWITALCGEISGGVTLWSLRVPHLAFFLAGALAIYALLRTTTGKAAAIFGALCWISMPMVAPKFINAEPDIVMSTLLFAAFCLWWQSTSKGRMSWLRWVGVAVLMALSGLTKGPQPVAYFTLGVGGYLLLQRQWRQLPGFIAANLVAIVLIGAWYALVYQPNDIEAWAVHSRLLTTTGLQLVRDHLNFLLSLCAEVLPATLLIGPAVYLLLRSRGAGTEQLMPAAALYALLCTLVLVVWPGGVATRYAMPGTLALAVICGLMFEHWRGRRPRVIVSTLVVAYLIFGGLLIRGWIVMPLWPHLFGESRIAGKTIAAVLLERPGPLYVIADTTEYNMLVYVHTPIRAVSLDGLAEVKGPATAVMLAAEEAEFRQQHPAVRLVDKGDIVSLKRPYRIVEVAQAE